MEVIGEYEIPDSWTAKGMNWNTPSSHVTTPVWTPWSKYML